MPSKRSLPFRRGSCLLACLVTALAGAGCSSGGAEHPAAAGTPSTSSAAFAADVAPVFQANCASGGAGCHGAPSVTMMGDQSRPYLGGTDALTPGEAATILAGIVNRPSAEDPSMPLVTPGDPTQSFLMLKMDGAQGSQSAQCMAGESRSCGLLMPYGRQTVLDQATRDKVRAWIAQGAKND
jgi:hypothetical protein